MKTVSVLPVDQNFCVDLDFLESSIEHGYIVAQNKDDSTNNEIREFWEKRSKESMEHIILIKLD